MKLLIMYISPLFCDFLSLTLKYSFHNFVLITLAPCSSAKLVNKFANSCYYKGTGTTVVSYILTHTSSDRRKMKNIPNWMVGSITQSSLLC
jgi:hypothetical protein